MLQVHSCHSIAKAFPKEVVPLSALVMMVWDVQQEVYDLV